MLEKVGHKVKKEKKWDTRSEERKQRKEEVGHEVNKIKKEKKKCRKKKKREKSVGNETIGEMLCGKR